MGTFDPTPEQKLIIASATSAFVSACPGAGKTRCIVERARVVFADKAIPKALAFLSFTHAAVDELEARLSRDQILPHPVFPHFIGTFDSFIWHFLVAPFGLKGTGAPLSLIADKNDLMIRPFPNARALPLSCFHRETCKIIPQMATKHGFSRNAKAHETAAASLRIALLENGQVDFEDVRAIARENISDKTFSDRLSTVLSARFGEVIVDEAQDCNPEDLEIVDWLRTVAKIHTKVVCDPHQSIYGFRGGVSDDLFEYEKRFPKGEQLSLTGNFRSTDHICQAVHLLRAPKYRGLQDDALGENKELDIKVHVLGYKGAVNDDIGRAFASLAKKHRIGLADCRVIAKTRATGKRAVGVVAYEIGDALGPRLADAAKSFQYASTPKEKRDALIDAHKVALSLSGKLDKRTYHQTLVEEEITDLSWRGEMVNVLRALEFDPSKGHTREEWVGRAQARMPPFLGDPSGRIARKIQNAKKLDDVLGVQPVQGLSPRTIHEVKGKEYPAMCVVMTSKTAKGILDHLECKDDRMAEEAREIYVAASRAEKLLVIACVKSQAERLVKHLESTGASVEFTQL
nr:ATP-dependent helicase [uncultured Hyphomonas sp.]